jgi:hypothetical protein
MRIIHLIVMSFFTFVNAQEHHEIQSQDKPSTHGMLIFGTEKTYASHLPMFHAPHNYQIILELELDPATKKLFIADQKRNTEYTTYTIEPEKFVLPEMMQNPKSFKANVYRGHFERGGIKIAADIHVSIKKIIYYTKFKTDEVRAIKTNFILFGNPKEQFIAHQITNKPDFDQIIQVKTTTNLTLENKNYELVTLNKTENSSIGVSGNEIEADYNSNPTTLTLLKQLYLEFDDLK